jgi:methionyl-tRNA formyltransferase
MRIIFLGTPSIALKTFYSISAEHEIAAVITMPDRPLGRHGKPVRSPIAEAAESEGIALYKPEKIDEELTGKLAALKADIFITFSYGAILKNDFLNITRLGGINIHPSLLPKLRGPSPIQSALLQGLTFSAITIQTVKPKIDSGDILFQKRFDISPLDDAESLTEKVGNMAAEIIIPVLNDIDAGIIKPVPQVESEATYCRMIKKSDGLIDWNKKAVDILNMIRAYVKWPVAYGFIDGERINIFKAGLNSDLSFGDFADRPSGTIIFADRSRGIVVKSGDSLINIIELQKQGKKILGWKEYLNGVRNLENKNFILENKNGAF